MNLQSHTIQTYIKNLKALIPPPDGATAHPFGPHNIHEKNLELRDTCAKIKDIITAFEQTTSALESTVEKRLLTKISDRGKGEQASTAVQALAKYTRKLASQQWNEIDKQGTLAPETVSSLLIHRVKAATANIKGLNFYVLDIMQKGEKKITFSHSVFFVDITVGPYPKHELRNLTISITGEENPTFSDFLQSLVKDVYLKRDYVLLHDIFESLIDRNNTIQKVDTILSQPSSNIGVSTLALYKALQDQIEAIAGNESASGNFKSTLRERHGLLKPVVQGVGVGLVYYVPPMFYDNLTNDELYQAIKANNIRGEHTVSFKVRSAETPAPLIGTNGLNVPLEFVMQFTPAIPMPNYLVGLLKSIIEGGLGNGGQPLLPVQIGEPIQNILQGYSNTAIDLNGVKRRYVLGNTLPPGALIHCVPFNNVRQLLPILKLVRQSATWCQLYKSCFDKDVTPSEENPAQNLSIIEIGGTGATTLSVLIFSDDAMHNIEINVEENGILNVKCPEALPFANSSEKDITEMLNDTHNIPQTLHHFLAQNQVPH